MMTYLLINVSLSDIFIEWYDNFRLNRSKDLGCSSIDDMIFADYIYKNFSLSLDFNIFSNCIDIKKDMINSFACEIFRETSYCREKNLVEDNQCMTHNKLMGVLSNCFFTNCIYCDKLLENTDFACIDKICENCENCENCEKLKYEIKSVSWSNYPPEFKFYKFGEISGVKKFLRNDNNIVVLHTKTGYYYTTVKNILNDRGYTMFTIDDKNRNISLKKFISFDDNKKRIKVNIQIRGCLFEKYTNNSALNLSDVKNCFSEIVVTIHDRFELPFKKNKNNFKSLEDIEDTIHQFIL